MKCHRIAAECDTKKKGEVLSSYCMKVPAGATFLWMRLLWISVSVPHIVSGVGQRRTTGKCLSQPQLRQKVGDLSEYDGCLNGFLKVFCATRPIT